MRISVFCAERTERCDAPVDVLETDFGLKFSFVFEEEDCLDSDFEVEDLRDSDRLTEDEAGLEEDGALEGEERMAGNGIGISSATDQPKVAESS